MPGLTAKSRATLQLRATTVLDPEQVLRLVKEAAGKVTPAGIGRALLLSGLGAAKAKVEVTSEEPGRINMSVSAPMGTLCSWPATTEAREGKTVLTVGPLGNYATSQSTMLGVVPAGPKSIPGMDTYKRFLDQVQQSLAAADPTASVTVAQA